MNWIGGEYSTIMALMDGSLPVTAEADTSDPVIDFSLVFFDVVNSADDDTFYDFYDALEAWDWSKDMLFDLLDEFFGDSEDGEFLLELFLDVPDDQMERVYSELYYQEVEDSQGMYDAFECYEEVPFNQLQRQLELSASIPPQIAKPLLDFDKQQAICAVWQAAIAPQSETEAIFSEIPTLIMTGNYDPITPPSWGRIAGETLPNSTFTEFPGVGHAAIDGGECPLAIALAFLDNPRAPLDLSCISTMSVQFITQMPEIPQWDDE